MAAVEALNSAQADYNGALIFESQDHQFVSLLATSVVEIKDQTRIDFQGTYDEYRASQPGAWFTGCLMMR